MRFISTVPLIGALLFSGLSTAASPDGDRSELARIPANLQRFIEDGTVSGVLTLISHRGQIVEFKAQGMADIEANRQMRKDTIFQIMSMTKPVTAVGIMMLAEEGKLSLRESVERYLPEFHGLRVAATLGPEATRVGTPERAITIRDLLTHTAGIADSAPLDIHDYPQLMNRPLKEVVEHWAKQPLLFQPGTKWSYSSPGIEILGRIIEVCSGQKYEDFIADRILRPLEMKDSFFFPTQAQTQRIAMVYQHESKKLVRSTGSILGGDPTLYRKGAVFSAPGWGLYSTASDLVRFYQMMLNGGSFEGKRYLSTFSVKLMTEVHTGDIRPTGWMGGTGYGLAWEVVNDAYGEAVGHAKGTYGHEGAFGTQGWIDPSNELIRILLVQNSDGTTNSMQSTFMLMAEAAVSK